MKRAWQGMSVLFFAFSSFVFVSSLAYPLFDRLGPGPGFFPFWLSGFAAVLSLVLLAQVTTGRLPLPSEEGFVPDLVGARRIQLVVASLLAVLLLLGPLGFRLTMLLFLLFLPWALGVRNHRVTVTIAVVCSFGIFHLFYYVLKLPLPVGVFGI